MSSRYEVLCLNHDPAIEIFDHDRTRDEAIADAREPGRIEGHHDCDLLIARYSGALVEIGCPGSRGHNGGYHSGDEWVDVAWLRLLYIAHAHDIGVGELRIPNCWTRERVLKLWALLGMERLP